MVYKPLDLLFDHLLLRNEHVFKNFNQFCLKGGVGDSLSHLHDLDNRFLKQDRRTWSKREASKNLLGFECQCVAHLLHCTYATHSNPSSMKDVCPMNLV